MTQTLQNTTSMTPPPLTLPQGFEMELGSFARNRIGVDKIRRALRHNNIHYCKVVTDGSSNVDVEVICPPLLLDEECCETYIKPVQDIVESEGARIRDNCGGHIHVGLKPVIDMNAQEFNRIQIEHWSNNTTPSLSDMNASYIAPSITLGNEIPFTLIKDVILTYAKNQTYISSMLPESRRFHRWAYPIHDYAEPTNIGTNFSNCRTIANLISNGLTKQKAINLLPYSSFGTMEFRQGASTLNSVKLAKWAEFILHLFRQSSAFRINWNTGGENVVQYVDTTTPQSIGRNGSFINVMYDMLRNQNNGNGATIEELMNRFGRGAQNIRSRVSEFRRKLGHGAIVTHTQQANNHVYGDGQIYCRYQVLHSYRKPLMAVSNLSLVGNPDYNIFLGMDIDLKNWIDSRINQLR